MAPPLITVLIVNFNGGSYLERCLAALARQEFRDFRAIVVDNGSTDGSLDGAVPDDPRFDVLRLGRNLGFAAANNRGAERADSPWLVLLNPDAFAEPDWLARLAAAAGRHDGVAMFGSTQIDAARPDRLDGAGDGYFCLGAGWRRLHGRERAALPATTRPTFGPCAAAAMYRTEAFRAVEGFDERYFCYGEDTDLAFRLRLQGHRCLQLPDAIVHHVGSGITGAGSAFCTYHLVRNQIWTFVKNTPGPLLWLLPGHLALQASLLARAILRGQGRVVARGLMDALRGLPAMLRSRATIQHRRTASWRDIARAMTWLPPRLSGRR